MESADIEILGQALAWLESGEPVWLVTVVATWGASPRPPGAILAVGAGGRLAGSVSGGCVEYDLVGKLLRGEVAAGRPQTVTYGVSREDAARHRIPCGGTLELVAEPLGDVAGLRHLIGRLERRECVARRLDLADGRVTLRPAGRQEALSCDGRVMENIFGPRWRLALIGANHVSRYVAALGQMLDYAVTVIDPRDDYLDSWPLPDVAPVRCMPDDWIEANAPDAQTALVALTHDPVLDDLALIAGLRSDAFYVGALGSARNQAKRRERLRQFEVDDAALARLHGPVGLPIGSRTPPEIAVSILAEITAARRGRASESAPLPAAVVSTSCGRCVDH